MNDAYTENLGDFGYREIALLKDILVAWCDGKGLPDCFERDGIKPAMNRNSGYVFLTNTDYQCALINPESGDLELHHFTPHEGHEGFLKDLLTEHSPADLNPDDVEYLVYAIQNETLADSFIPEAWQKLVNDEKEAV